MRDGLESLPKILRADALTTRRKAEGTSKVITHTRARSSFAAMSLVATFFLTAQSQNARGRRALNSSSTTSDTLDSGPFASVGLL